MNLLNRLLVVLTFSLLFQAVFAQDTIRVMQYNLLFYGLYTDFCTESNNNREQKDAYLRTIINHFQPDIFTVNELGRGAHNLTLLRDNVLNIDGTDYFDYAKYTNTGNGWFANGLFFDTRKFGLVDEVIVNTLLRDINLYRLYYRAPDLHLTGDTVFLTCIVAHLKAGQTASDQQTRTEMVTNVMNYLNQNNYSGNILFMGDFNMRSSYEQAFQLMVNHPNPDIRFNDPIDVVGIWGRNSAMAPYHTQSPRTGSHPCFVTGGLDDRYDFILATQPVMEGSEGFLYLEGTYKAMGQDGLRYNQSLINPPNNSEPPEVIEALYGMSDHLPVVMKMVTTDLASSFVSFMSEVPTIRHNNPVKDSFTLHLNGTPKGTAVIEISSLTGAVRYVRNLLLTESHQEVLIPIEKINSGFYLLRVTFDSGFSYTSKVFII